MPYWHNAVELMFLQHTDTHVYLVIVTMMSNYGVDLLLTMIYSLHFE